MAQRKDMVLVKVDGYTFKVHKHDVDDYLKAHDGAEVVGGYETKDKPKPAAKKAAPKTDGKE